MSRHEDTLLALIAGFVDTLGFVALFGLFTAHVTGNFVLIGADLAGEGKGVLVKLLAFPAFIAGIALSSLVVKSVHRQRSPRVARRLYLLQAFLLALFLAAGLHAVPVTNPDSPWVLLCGSLGATAMGVQNAHSKLVKRVGIPNTVMTGNVTQAVLDAIDILFGGSEEPAERRMVRERFVATMPAVLGFAIGAISGALAYVHLSFWALLFAVALLLFMAWRAGRLSLHAGTQ
jgi:uncharacterized membrane protein YoaK (UPF0700 family)